MQADVVRWVVLPSVWDDRGCLTAVEGECDIPFRIERVFYMHHVIAGMNRGGHAHRETDQVAIAVHGSLKIEVSDGVATRSYGLSRPDRGLFLPRTLWVRLCDFSPGAVCLVLANTHYDASKSIRSWDEYLTYRAGNLSGALRIEAGSEGSGG